jgi:hypothetical protein
MPENSDSDHDQFYSKEMMSKIHAEKERRRMGNF